MNAIRTRSCWTRLLQCLRLVEQTVRGSYALCFLMFAIALPAFAHSETDVPHSFRWIHPASDPQLWNAIEVAFHDELVPDQANHGENPLDVYRYKYLRRIGVIDHSALVFVGHRPAKELTKENEWDEYYSAFNFDTATRQKTRIERAEWLWTIKFRRLATLGPSRVPDVTFTYLSCTECEPELLFAALQFDPEKSVWHIRSWEHGKDIWWATKDGLVVELDLDNGEDTISFDCAYGILDSRRTGFQDLAIRCKEVAYADSGRAKIDDSTLIYSSSDSVFKSRRVRDFSEIASLNAKLCRQTPKMWLCNLPFYVTATSEQNPALDEMFPSSTETARNLAAFKRLTRAMSMNDVVMRCGKPDEVGGSGISIFIYDLKDGSLVVIAASNSDVPIMYASHIERNGKTTPLIPEK